MTTGSQSPIDRLRGQAERAIASSKSRNTILPLLERLARTAAPGTDAARFAHRHLAEYLVEQNPWRALGHLRHALRAGAASTSSAPSSSGAPISEASDDDALHALGGLAHALLGNFHSAIAAYRRAVAVVPTNPWYQHNLGHLLDVGIDRPAAALPHLEAAHRAAGPDDGEISASLAHCLARLRRLPAALAHADVAVATCPDNEDHRRLRAWIAAGAIDAEDTRRDHDEPARRPPSAQPEPTADASSTGSTTAATVDPGADEVVATDGAPNRPRRPRRSAALAQLAERIRERLVAAGHAANDVSEVLRLWDGYGATLSPKQLKSAGETFWLALAEVAIEQLGELAPERATDELVVTVARRHGVATDRLRERWDELHTHRQKSAGRRRARR